MAWNLPIHSVDFDQIAAGSPEMVSRNGHLLMAFDAAAVESLVYKAVMPEAYVSGSNLTVNVKGFAASATSGTVRVRLAFEYIADGAHDIDADGYDTDQEANATADATSGEMFSATFTLANADIDAIAAGGLFRVKVTRVGTDGTNDTMTGDWQLQVLILSQ